MQIVEFRGKRSDNGEWIYGDLLRCGKTYIHPKVSDANEEENLKAFEVVPETVGQFTGLHDFNGGKLYVGDIIRFQHNVESGVYAIKFSINSFIALNINNAIDIRHYYLEEEGRNILQRLGNIHDNPELIKKENDDLINNELQEFAEFFWHPIAFKIRSIIKILKSKTRKSKKETAPEVEAQEQSENDIVSDQNKLQYLKEYGFVEVDEKLMQEAIKAMPMFKKCLTERFKEHKISYCRFFSVRGKKQYMFYGKKYLNSHSVDEIEAAFTKADDGCVC